MSYKSTSDTSRLGTPVQFKWLLGIVKVVLVLNLIDAIFTIVWVYEGLAREDNPLLAGVLFNHPVIFIVVKLALVSLGSILLWRYRYRPTAIIAIFIAFMVYYALLIYQIEFFSKLISVLFVS